MFGNGSPIVYSLYLKGLSAGAVIAFLITATAISPPELIMLSGMFKKKFIAFFIIMIVLESIVTGYLLNVISWGVWMNKQNKIMIEIYENDPFSGGCCGPGGAFIQAAMNLMKALKERAEIVAKIKEEFKNVEIKRDIVNPLKKLEYYLAR
ncbi:MAG: permease [Thermoproteota archaeon]